MAVTLWAGSRRTSSPVRPHLVLFDVDGTLAGAADSGRVLDG